METKTDSLKVGDEVKWMASAFKRYGFSCSTKYGKIISIEGDRAQVKQRKSGKVHAVALTKLVPITQPSPVTEVFNAIAGKPEATP